VRGEDRPARVCLITPGQPSTNPRLVKEADALAACGCQVHVIGAHCVDWATSFDADLVASRRWQFTFVDWRRTTEPARFWKIRLRHRAAGRLLRLPVFGRAALSARASSGTVTAALSPVAPELVRAATEVAADVYIAHNLGALPAAHAAAAGHAAAVGFDAEDFHSGELDSAGDRFRRAFVETVERAYLPRCDYVTAASPLIANAYRELAGIPLPTSVLNVFPMRDRPASFRGPEPGRPLRLYWFSQTIGSERGLEDAVRALGPLRECPVELHLRGRWQAGYRERLLRLADEARVPRGRIVHHDPAPADEMVRLAAEYDIGLALEHPVSTNRDIALTNKIFVYLLAGLAVVATRTRAQAAILGDLGVAARGYEPGDAAGLAEGLRAWLENPRQLAAARQAAWRKGETRYNWDCEQQVFLRTVRDVLARTRERRTASARSAARGAGRRTPA
jgi:glycosyltransferase involved in cell wall biosynthesis